MPQGVPIAMEKLRRAVQARCRQGDDLVCGGLVDIAVAGEQFLFEQQITQLLYVAHCGCNLDLGQSGLAVARLHQGGDLGRPDTRT